MAFDILDAFQSFRTILCICPHCNEIHRLSDLRLQYEGKAPLTWLDTLDAKSRALDSKEERFDEKEKELRDAAAERGRKKVSKIINKSMVKELASLNLNPYDIKAIMHPVDYVVFKGMNDDDLKDVLFLSKKTSAPSLEAARRQVKDAVQEKNYDWKTARVSTDGKIEYE